MNNEYNLNIPRYIDTYEEKEPINLNELIKKHDKLLKDIEKVNYDIVKYYKDNEINNPINGSLLNIKC